MAPDTNTHTKVREDKMEWDFIMFLCRDIKTQKYLHKSIIHFATRMSLERKRPPVKKNVHHRFLGNRNINFISFL